jgi:hypothetical protein
LLAAAVHDFMAVGCNKKNAPDTHYIMAVGCIATDKHQLGMTSRLLVAL